MADFAPHPVPDIGAYEGQRVELTASWSGEAAGATFQWQKDLVSLPGETQQTLVLPSFQASQAGSYRFLMTAGGQTLASPAGRVSLRSQVALSVIYHYPTIPPTITEGVVRLSGNTNGGAAVKADGSTVTWGFWQGPTAADGAVVDVAVSGYGPAYWLMADGTVGVSSIGPISEATRFRRIPGLSDAVAISSMGSILRRNGTVVQHEYEYGTVGQLTNPKGTLASRSLGLHGVVELSVSPSGHSVALLRDGSLFIAGNPDFGVTHVPPGLTNVMAVSALEGGVAALKADGSIAVWGDFWQTPVAPAGETFVALARHGAAAITSGGNLIAWDRDSGWLGDTLANLMQWNPGITDPLLPLLAADDSGWLVLAASEPGGQPIITNLPERLAGKGHPFHFRIEAKNRPSSYGASGLPAGLAVDAATGLISGAPSQRGTFNVTLSATTATGATATKPLRLTVLDKQITTQPQGRFFNAPANHTLSVTVSGEGPFSYQWQRNGADLAGATSPSLAFVPALATDAGTYQCLVTDADGTLASAEAVLEFTRVAVVWGGSVAASAPPADLAALRSISAAGYAYVGGLRPDRTGVWWGPGSPSPLLSAFDSGGTALASFQIGSWFAGSDAAGNILADPSLWNGNGFPSGPAAGWNADDDTYFFAVGFDGRVLGRNLDSDGYPFPQPAYNLKHVSRIAVGASDGIALLTNGKVVNWIEPRDALAMDAADIAAGAHHFVAVRRDGTVYCWGSNEHGQCDVPPGLTNVVQVAAGTRHTLALKSDGTVVGWGFIAAGEPVVPAGLEGICAIAASGDRGAALLARDPAPGPARVLTSRHLVGQVGEVFFLHLPSQNDPTSWSVADLPLGFTFDSTAHHISGTPAGVGDFTFQVTVANALGGETMPVTLHVIADAFQTWAASEGIAPDRNADPDGDRLNNLAEFAFGLHPLQPDGDVFLAKKVPPSPADWPNLNPRVSLHFQRVASRSLELRYTLEVSSDLARWAPLAVSAGGDPFYIPYPYPEVVGGMDWNPPLPVETPDAANPDMIHANLTFSVLDQYPSLFFRMRVED